MDKHGTNRHCLFVIIRHLSVLFWQGQVVYLGESCLTCRVWSCDHLHHDFVQLYKTVCTHYYFLISCSQVLSLPEMICFNLRLMLLRFFWTVFLQLHLIIKFYTARPLPGPSFYFQDREFSSMLMAGKYGLILWKKVRSTRGAGYMITGNLYPHLPSLIRIHSLMQHGRNCPLKSATTMGRFFKIVELENNNVNTLFTLKH